MMRGGRGGRGGFRRRPESHGASVDDGTAPTQASGAPKRPIKEPPPLFPNFDNLPMPPDADEGGDVYKKALHLQNFWKNSVYYMKNPEPKPEVVKYSDTFKPPPARPISEILLPQYGHLFPEELQKATLAELRKRKAAARRADGDDALKRLEREEGTQRDEEGAPKKKAANANGEEEEEKDDEEKDDDDANALEDLDAEEFENEFQDDDDGAGDAEDGGDGEAVY